jgi:hypothetical protein
MRRVLLFLDYLVHGMPWTGARRRRFGIASAWRMAALVARLPRF